MALCRALVTCFLIGFVIPSLAWRPSEVDRIRIADGPVARPQSLAYQQMLNCPRIPTRPTPTSVHDLGPGDISVVMALGDSISAGFAMHASNLIVDGLVEYRGDVFSIGGNAGQPTIPNFLKIVGQSDVYGASIGITGILDAVVFRNRSVLPNDHFICHLNAAQSNAKVEHLAAQVDYLEDQMARQGGMRDDDWKLVTVLIGVNNICAMLDDPTVSDPAEFERGLDAALMKLRAAFKRVFVNVLPLFELTQVLDIPATASCRAVWKFLQECPPLHDSDDSRARVKELRLAYNNAIDNIVRRWRKENHDDFAVVKQPFLVGEVITSSDYVSKLDCYHPSGLANQQVVACLWTTLML
eukprot:jgi/Mesvir1/380/Mv11275-RA.1